MKKIIALCLMLILAFGALSVNAETISGMPNPITEYETLDVINEIVGSRLTRPAVMGVTGESYSVIDCGTYKIAQYIFSVNGLEYTFRCAAVADEDISGVYIDGETAFPNEYSGDVIEFAIGEGYKLARWFDINGQYCLALNDAENTMDNETFEGIAAEMKSLTSIVPSDEEVAAFFDAMEGEYQDLTSQRASLVVTSNGAEGANFVVYWGSSADETYIWFMSVTLGEDGLLNYSDCMECVANANDEGEMIVTVNSENGEGFWNYSEGLLYWNGAEDESCRDCVFEGI